MAMHVLQLGPYPPPEGGISRNMLAIRDELLKRGDRCTIIAGRTLIPKSYAEAVIAPELRRAGYDIPREESAHA